MKNLSPASAQAEIDALGNIMPGRSSVDDTEPVASTNDWFNNLPPEQQSAVARANRERGLPFDTNPDNLRSEPTSSPKCSAVDTDVAAAAPGRGRDGRFT